MLTGYEQARSIACALTGDVEGAKRVDFTLPATGVCSGPAAEASISCCVPEPPVVVRQGAPRP